MSEPRLKLQPHEGKRLRFTGILRDFRTHSCGYRRLIRTAAIEDLDLEDSGEYVCDHVWVQYSEALEEVGATPGDRLSFEAAVTQYQRADKSSGAQRINWSLSNPTDVRLVNRANVEAISEDIDGALAPVMPQEDAEAIRVDVVTAIKTVQRAAQAVGGWKKLEELVDLLKTA